MQRKSEAVFFGAEAEAFYAGRTLQKQRNHLLGYAFIIDVLGTYSNP